LGLREGWDNWRGQRNVICNIIEVAQTSGVVRRVALSAHPSRTVVAASMEVKVIDDVADSFFEGFELRVCAVEIVYVEVEGGAG